MAICMVVLPSRLKVHLGRWLLGWKIHPTAHIGPSLIRVGHLTMGPGASIGPFNVIKDLEELHLAEGASISTRNWIAGFRRSSDLAADTFPHSPNRLSSLVLGAYAMISVGHDIDCSDRVEIGDYGALVGFRCAILTHSLNLVRDRFVTGPVRIGHHASVMSGSTLLSGTQVPARSIVSAGSVVNTRLTEELTFYSGNPAVAVRSLPESMAVFHRGEDPDAPREAGAGVGRKVPSALLQP
jgi:carbonic anhydrase/acetyltransferase-like protein (isoleucine patch superfamily)